MAGRIVSDPGRVFTFVQQYMPVNMIAGMKGLGLERDGELVAGVLYEGYNHHNVWMHVAIEGGGTHVTREFVRYVFEYPFIEMGCRRVSGYVEASNMSSRRLCEHLGFEQEAVLQGAASDGGDVVLYVMRRQDCRYLEN